MPFCALRFLKDLCRVEFPGDSCRVESRDSKAVVAVAAKMDEERQATVKAFPYVGKAFPGKKK